MRRPYGSGEQDRAASKTEATPHGRTKPRGKDAGTSQADGKRSKPGRLPLCRPRHRRQLLAFTACDTMFHVKHRNA
jgi:hypothetical protein